MVIPHHYKTRVGGVISSEYDAPATWTASSNDYKTPDGVSVSSNEYEPTGEREESVVNQHNLFKKMYSNNETTCFGL